MQLSKKKAKNQLKRSIYIYKKERRNKRKEKLTCIKMDAESERILET